MATVPPFDDERIATLLAETRRLEEITRGDHRVEVLAALYRERGDAENPFDELKNQWGWGGYTTHDLERCNLSARAVALML